MRMMLVRLALAFLLLPPTSRLSNAQGVSFPELDASVLGLEGVIYLDLVRQLIPDLALNGTVYEGHDVIEVRNLAGPGGTKPPATINLYNVATLDVASDGKERRLLLVDLGQASDSAEGFAILALYDLAGAPKLVDAANVAYDRNTSFGDPGRLPLGEGKDAVITMSTHFNSGQGYVTTVLILIRNDRLELIDSIFTFDEKFCSFTRVQQPSLRRVDRGGKTYGGIEVTVNETTASTGQDCEGEKAPEPGTRTIAATYRWDGERFAADSDALGKLAEENAERF